MKQDTELRYTEAAKVRLEKLKKDVLVKFEAGLLEKRYVPGDKVVEITASDVEELSQSMRLVFNTKRTERIHLLKILGTLYSLGGLLLIIIGTYYDELRLLLKDPQKAALVLSGIVVLILGLLIRFYLMPIEREKMSLFNGNKHSEK